MLGWLSQHRLLTWSIAWGVTGIGFFTADVFSDPSRGPLWTAVVFGLVAWSVAGATTLLPGRIADGLVVWGLAFLVAFGLAAIWGKWFEHNEVGPVASAGFIGALRGWSVGAALGALLSAYLGTPPQRALRVITFAAAWGLSFLVAGYIGLVAAMFTAEAAKGVLAFLGNQRLALTVGWGIGSAFGGLLASALGMAAHRRIIDSSTKAAV